MKNNKQQTAVEWLWEIAYNRELTSEAWKQAKAMEKEQIMDARRNGSYKATEKYGETRTNIQYYNETYRGGEQ